MIYLAGGVDAAGAVQAPITTNSTTAVREWTKTRSGAEYALVAAYGTWGSGTLLIEYQPVSGVSYWITIASLTTGATTSALFKILPNGNYRATLSGATSPSLSIILKPV